MCNQELSYSHIRTLTSYVVFMAVADSQTPILSREVQSMIEAFDIFHIDGGQPVWQEGALTLDDAIARVQQFGASRSGEYFIRSKRTGVEVSLTIRRSGNVGSRFSPRSQPLAVKHRPAQMNQPDN